MYRLWSELSKFWKSEMFYNWNIRPNFATILHLLWKSSKEIEKITKREKKGKEEIENGRIEFPENNL